MTAACTGRRAGGPVATDAAAPGEVNAFAHWVTNRGIECFTVRLMGRMQGDRRKCVGLAFILFPRFQFYQTKVGRAIAVNDLLTTEAIFAITRSREKVFAVRGVLARRRKDVLVGEDVAKADVKGGTKRIAVIAGCRL